MNARSWAMGTLVIVAVVAATTRCGDGSGATPDSGSATGAGARVSASTWSGRWRRQFGTGDSVFTLVQRGSHVTGTFHWTWCTSVSGGRITGTAHGGSLNATFAHRGGPRGTLAVTLARDRRSMRGTFSVRSPTCASSAPFHASYVGPPASRH